MGGVVGALELAAVKGAHPIDGSGAVSLDKDVNLRKCDCRVVIPTGGRRPKAYTNLVIGV